MLKTVRIVLLHLMIVAGLVVPATIASATGGVTLSNSNGPAPIPVASPRLSPRPIPHSMVLEPYVIYNENLVPPPMQSIEADDANGGAAQESPGRGIHQNNVKDNDEMHTHAVVIDDRDAARGLTLYPQAAVCNDFNGTSHWSASDPNPPNDIWTDYYGGWAPYAIDDGLYQAKNVVFTMERNVGPGENYGKGYSAKIASNQPYAAGYGSPKIDVTPGAQVTVKVNYLIWDHDFKGLDYDWASMGVKADATAAEAHYVNGYTRGQWAQLEHTVTAGPTGQIMVLLQGHSPASLNSNIYFDDVRIMVNGAPLESCVHETPAPKTAILPPVNACIPIPSPADVMLTVDVSGSIRTDINTARSALKTFVDGRNLTADNIGLVGFDIDALNPLALSQDKAVIESAIDGLVSRDKFTSIATGVIFAQAALEQATANSEKIIVLLTDGFANASIALQGLDEDTAFAEARSAASTAKAAGVRVITVGIGIDNPAATKELMRESVSLLTEMASSPDDFFYVENLSQLQSALSAGCVAN